MRETGKVVKFFMDKQFGFIRSDNNEIDLFLHVKNIEPDKKGFKKVAVGDSVEYDIVIENRGPIAKNIKILYSIYNNSNYDGFGNK